MSKPVTKTIRQWEPIFKVRVLDPDGFDRNDPLLYERKFTRKEFQEGLQGSTVGTLKPAPASSEVEMQTLAYWAKAAGITFVVDGGYIGGIGGTRPPDNVLSTKLTKAQFDAGIGTGTLKNFFMPDGCDDIQIVQGSPPPTNIIAPSINDPDLSKLKMFAIRNADGKWFRSQSNDYDSCWKEEFRYARVYQRTGGARAAVTYFHKNFPQHSLPKIYQFNCTGFEIIDESARIIKKVEKDKRRKEEYRAKVAQYQLDTAKREVQAAQDRLAQLQSSN